MVSPCYVRHDGVERVLVIVGAQVLPRDGHQALRGRHSLSSLSQRLPQKRRFDRSLHHLSLGSTTTDIDVRTSPDISRKNISRIGRSSASTIGSQKSSGQSPDERHKGREREREETLTRRGERRWRTWSATARPRRRGRRSPGRPLPRGKSVGAHADAAGPLPSFLRLPFSSNNANTPDPFVFFLRRISRTVCVRAKPEEGVEGVSAPGRLSPPIASRGLTPPPNPPRSSRSDHSFLRTAGPEEEGERAHGTRRRNRRRRQARPGGTLRRNLGGRLRQRHGTFFSFFFLLLPFVDDAHQALTRTQTLSISFSVYSAGRRRSLGC